MAKAADHGVTETGNWRTKDELFESAEPFELISATAREASGQYKESIVFGFRFLYSGDGQLYQFSLERNDIRTKYAEILWSNPGETVNGVREERGLVMGKGSDSGKGNRPFIFRDATDDEINAAIERAAVGDEQVPF